MNKLSDYFSDPLKIAKGAITVLVCVFIIVYAWVQLSGDITSGVETLPAAILELNNTVDTQGYIFRDETLVKKLSGGTVVTVVSDGQRVSKGEKLAAIYRDKGEISLQDDINRIQRRIDVLNKSAVETEYLVSDISKVDEDIQSTLNEIYISVDAGELSSAVNYGSEFLVKLNKHELIINSQKNYNDEKANLIAEKNKIESRIKAMSDSVYASDSGYFYGDVDGYEGVFDPSLVDELDIAGFEKLINSSPDESAQSTSAGKIVNDFVWFVGCVIDISELSGLEEGSYYEISFPESGDKIITMKLYKLLRENSKSRALAIFRSNVNPDGFNYQRAQKIQIVRDTVSGLGIPKQSLRVIDGVKGVYILFGDVIHFKRTEILAETENMYIVSDNKSDYFVFDDEKNDKKADIPSLSLYDNVIVAGKDLFEGKIIG